MRLKLALLLLLLVSPASATLKWWDSDWNYRVCMEVNSTTYSRTEWPIEFALNLTQELNNSGGAVNETSLRLFEQDSSSGAVLYETPNQFDKPANFNYTTNFYGTLDFIMNGTTPAQSVRTYCLYYDTSNKSVVSYAGIPYSWDGEEFQINVTIMDGSKKGLSYWIDTIRGENASGIYRLRDFSSNEFWTPPTPSENPMEYMQYSNGTYNFSFDLRNNLTVKYAGPVRVIIEQTGNEVLWNSTTPAEGEITKRYTFYNQSQWIKVEQIYKNTANYNITRNSTLAGALAFEVARANIDNIIIGNGTDPGSWYWFAASSANFHIGVINVEESGGNYTSVDRNSSLGRGGIELSTSTIEPNQTIREVAALHFNGPSQIRGSPADAQVKNLRNRLLNRENVTKTLSEKWAVIIKSLTNYSQYNKGDNVTIFANATVDSGVINLINATLSSPGGNFSLVLYDDGTHGDSQGGDALYTNFFVINETNLTGQWNMTAYAWDVSGKLLNTSNTSFGVFDNYVSTLSIHNYYGYINRTINSTLVVRNYRNDTYIPGANVTCAYGSTDAKPNVTDYNNGTYLVQFTSPSSYGVYTLTCNSTKFNNTGTAQDIFTSIEYITNMTVILNFTGNRLAAENVSFYAGQNFTIFANTTNLGNGTARDVNITLYQPAGWLINSSFENIGDMNTSDYKLNFFELGVPANETPGYYLVNATIDWDNDDSSTGSYNTSFNITVLENPVLKIPEVNLSIVATPGTWNFMGNITLLSEGNFKLRNVTFNVTGLGNMTFNFTPSNVSSLFQGQNTSVEVWVWMAGNHSRGTFNGTLNASAINAYDSIPLEVKIIETYMSVNATPSQVTSDKMRWYDFQNFTIVVNTTNKGTSSALSVNISMELPEANWTTNVTNNKYVCGDVAFDGFCTRVYTLSVKGSLPGNYNATVNVSWNNPGVGLKYNTTKVGVVVQTNREFQIDEPAVSGVAYHGNSTIVGNYTLRNTGNAQVNGVGTAVFGFPNFNVSFIPLVNFIPAGTVIGVDVNVTVPLGYLRGNYTGTINVTSSDGGYDWLPLNVTVPLSKTWVMAPENCTTEVAFDEGNMCNVIINNTGNDAINFTISPQSINYTYVNVTNFSLPKQGSYVFSIKWNLTGVSRDYYKSVYNVSAGSSQPLWRFLNTSMIPRELAQINTSVTSNITQSLSNITLYVNITDKSAQGLNYTKLIVFRPDGITETRNMTLLNQSNNSYWYSLTYPGTWGNNDVYGYYVLQVEVQDNLGLYSRKNTTIYTYPLVDTKVSTRFPTYFTGETLSLYVNTTDLSGKMFNANVSVNITDPQGYLRYRENFSSSGMVLPIPTFTVPSDAPLGNYTIVVRTDHYDSVANKTVNGTTLKSFNVREFYQTSFETSFVWYPDSVMNFYLLLYSDNPFQEPDSINLTVLDPAQNVYFTTASFTAIETTNTSKLYLYSYAMPANSPIGYYLAEFTVNEGGRQVKEIKSFRVSQGGPFDVVIPSLVSEVPQGGNQNFTVLLENMGDFSQDVFLSYWIQGNNVTYDKVTGEAIFVPSGGNRTLNRSLAIFSNQPVGNYTLHVKLNYSLIKPPIEVTRTFRVISGNITAPPSATTPGIIQPVEAAVIELTITNVFPDQLILNRGAIGYLTIELKNTGNVDLHDITAFFEDIDKNWFEVVRGVDTLTAGSNGYLIVKFTIPSSASARTYVSKMRVISKEVETSEFYKLLIFKTQQEALRARITTLRDELMDLESQTGKIAARGGDVTKILALLRKSRELLDVADTYLKEDSTVDAIKTISDVENTIEEIKYRLEVAKPQFLPSIPLPKVPSNWYVILITLVLLVIIAVIVFKKFAVFKTGERRKALLKLKSVMTKSRNAEESSDVFETIKKQYEEGMISRETLEELKGIIK